MDALFREKIFPVHIAFNCGAWTPVSGLGGISLGAIATHIVFSILPNSSPKWSKLNEMINKLQI